MKVFTAEDLIASVQRRISIPSDIASEGKADQDILDVLDEVMMDTIIPAILRLKEDYLVRTLTFATSASPNRYAVPSRAIGNALRDVYYTDTNGTKKYLPPVTRELLPFYGDTAIQVPDGFYFEGDRLILVPPSTGGNLNLSFFFRPGQLVKSTAYRQVVSVDSTTSITVDSTVPTGWSTATTFDVHSDKSGAEVRVFDYGASTVSGTTITFTQAIDGSVDGTLAVDEGDYVVVAETAAVPALPRDAHPALAQAAACRLLESDGDSEMLKIARETLMQMIDSFGDLFETRVQGKPQIFVNRRSLLFSQRPTRW